jgi:hypothetical protein
MDTETFVADVLEAGLEHVLALRRAVSLHERTVVARTYGAGGASEGVDVEVDGCVFVITVKRAPDPL